MSLTEEVCSYVPMSDEESDSLFDAVEIQPFVHLSNQIVQECSDAVQVKFVEVLHNLGIVIHPKHERGMSDLIAKIMASNSSHIDEVFGVLESVGAVEVKDE